jgi:hypothetical protein
MKGGALKGAWIVRRRVRKTAKSDYKRHHACPSICSHETTRFLQELWSLMSIFEYFLKFCLKNSSFVKIWQEWKLYTWRPIYIYEVVEKSKHTFMFNKLFTKILPCMSWRGKTWYSRTFSIIRRMLFACWITKATDTRKEYVIYIAYTLQQRLHERASKLRLYVHYVLFVFWLSLCHLPCSPHHLKCG